MICFQFLIQWHHCSALLDSSLSKLFIKWRWWVFTNNRKTNITLALRHSSQSWKWISHRHLDKLQLFEALLKEWLPILWIKTSINVVLIIVKPKYIFIYLLITLHFTSMFYVYRYFLPIPIILTYYLLAFKLYVRV